MSGFWALSAVLMMSFISASLTLLALAKTAFAATCTVNAIGNGTDDAPAILKAFEKCGKHGSIVLPSKNYTIAQPITTHLENATFDLHGYLSFTPNITYWVANSYRFPFQNQSIAWSVQLLWDAHTGSKFTEHLGTSRVLISLWTGMMLEACMGMVKSGIHGPKVQGTYSGGTCTSSSNLHELEDSFFPQTDVYFNHECDTGHRSELQSNPASILVFVSMGECFRFYGQNKVNRLRYALCLELQRNSAQEFLRKRY